MTDTRPASPGSDSIKTSGTNPADLDPDLAAMKILNDLMGKMDTPSSINKQFAARKAIFQALNHTEENKTGYDSSLRVKLYSSYERSSLNIDAKMFNSLMAFLMKPKMIIQGLPTAPAQSTEPGFFGRAWNRLTGKGQPTPAPQAGQQ